MFDAIPLGSARGIVCHGDGEIEGNQELRLEFGLPGTAAVVAATAVGDNEKLASAGVAERVFPFPPTGDGMSGEGRGIVRDPEKDRAAVGPQIVDAVRPMESERKSWSLTSTGERSHLIPVFITVP
jgi:hypothetical protein